jgi:hypothetical protein
MQGPTAEKGRRIAVRSASEPTGLAAKPIDRDTNMTSIETGVFHAGWAASIADRVDSNRIKTVHSPIAQGNGQ